MKSRALASIALGAAVMLGATGCSMISPQATTIPYAAAEGVNVPDSSGNVKVRNVFFLIDDEGTTANLVGAFVNDTTKPQTATFQVGDSGDVYSVEVEPGEVVSYGVPNGETKRIEDFTGKLGGTIPVTFQSGGKSAQVYAPVLDGKLLYLEDSVPLPSPSTTDTPTPTPTPTETTAG